MFKGYVDTSDWSTAKVQLSDGYCIEQKILSSEAELEEFCEKYGYVLVSFKKGTNRLCS